MRVVPVPDVLPGGASLVEVPPTTGARWLRPSAWPEVTEFLFRAREPDTDRFPVLITRYDDILSMLLDPDRTWQREIPLSVIPQEERHCMVDASWMLDGEKHRQLRRQLRTINHGSTPEARKFTRRLTALLTDMTLRQPPPWDLARVVDEVSIRVIIEHTLQAPPLLPYTVRLRELIRACAPRDDDGQDVLAYFRIGRQLELEDILATVLRRPEELPPHGLARHLVGLTDTRELAEEQLVSQLGMLIASHESQSATTSSLIGMLLEYDLFERTRQESSDPEMMRGLVAEGGRRGISFPFSLVTPARQVTISGREVLAGEPVVISYQAANMDPSRFGPEAPGFDPSARRPSPLAFGEGPHRCQGEMGAEQFIEDVLLALCSRLPRGIRLGHDNQILREVSGVSWAVTQLPVVPDGWHED